MCQGVIVINTLMTVWQITMDRIASCTLGKRSNSPNLMTDLRFCRVFDDEVRNTAGRPSAGSGRSKKNVIKNDMPDRKQAITQGPVVKILRWNWRLAARWTAPTANE